MINLLEQLEPATKLTWTHYSPAAQIDWLHGENKENISSDQIAPSRGPASIIPSAVFTIETYLWDLVEW